MTFQRIVVGVDFSTASLNAVRWVAGQFAPRARVFVVHVVPEMRTPRFLCSRPAIVPNGGGPGPTLYPGLRVFADLAGASQSDVEILTGVPSTELARVAKELNADLICVGRTRKRRGSGRFGATTPQRLLSRTNIPVLIVPDTVRLTPGAVLAAVSDGADGREVLRAAGRLAATWGVRLDALHALEPEVLNGVRGSLASSDAELCQLAEEWIASQATEFGLQPAQVNAIARVGDAGEETVAHAARDAIGLIVAGRRRYDWESDDAGVDPGSTIRLITWASACPVLVLGPPAAAGEARPTMPSIRRPSLATARSRLVLPAQRPAAALRRSYRPSPGDGGDAA
jgi:nucleotide-binding universal stress UspA family protein